MCYLIVSFYTCKASKPHSHSAMFHGRVLIPFSLMSDNHSFIILVEIFRCLKFDAWWCKQAFYQVNWFWLYDGFNNSVFSCIYNLQVLVLVGDQLDYSDDVCGVVLSVRFNEDILSVWNRNASDHQVCTSTWCSIDTCSFRLLPTHSCSFSVQAVMALRDSIKRHLKLPHSYLMEYKPHDASRRDNSSYRNTWLRG